MTKVTENQSDNTSGSKYIDSRCIVEFRPADDWQGQYGFDWFRRGEDSICDNSDYRKIVGKYIPEAPYNGAQCDFKRFAKLDDEGNGVESINKDKADDCLDKLCSEYPIRTIKGKRNYYVPYISLFYENPDDKNADWGLSEAVVKLLIDISNINLITYDNKIAHSSNIRRIVFKCEKGVSVCTAFGTKVTKNAKNSYYIELDDMDTGSDGNKHCEEEVKIKITSKEGDGVRDINVYAQTPDEIDKGLQGSFAGKVKVVCKEPKYIKVRFINVKLKKEGSQAGRGLDNSKLTEKQKQLCQFLAQALIVPVFSANESIDIGETDLKVFRAKDKNNKDCLHRRVNGLIEMLIEKYKKNHFLNDEFKIFILQEDGLSGGEHVEYNTYSSGNIDMFFIGDVKGSSFVGEIDGLLNDIAVKGKYSGNIEGSFAGNISGILDGDMDGVSYIKTEYYGIDGHAYQSKNPRHKDYNHRSAIVFNHEKDSTIAHELLHCMGLVHSFENSSKHTFKKEETNNIMDYSYETISLWHWQWKKLRGEDKKQ